MTLNELYKQADYHDKSGMLFHADCLDIMEEMDDASVDFTLTDIPYDAVNRDSNGLRNLDKGNADIITFDLDEFLKQVYRVTSNSICIFCGKEQFSQIYQFFADIGKGTVRPIIWEKTNPSPMNGQYIYLSGVEMGVWYKKQGAKTFNAHCKNSVFHYPNGRSKLHPTEKNHDLLKDLIQDNSNEGQVIFDPCCGSAAHCLVATELKRKYIGVELDDKYFNIAADRMKGMAK